VVCLIVQRSVDAMLASPEQKKKKREAEAAAAVAPEEVAAEEAPKKKKKVIGQTLVLWSCKMQYACALKLFRCDAVA
jgi:hypothetical protein